MMRGGETPALLSSRAGYSHSGNGYPSKISTLRSKHWRPKAAFPGWAKHQRIRDCKPKFPGPDESDTLQDSAASCGELPQVAALIQSESNPNPNPNPESESNTRGAAFDAFWAAYPRKVGKGDARKAFGKVRVELGTLLSAIEAQKASQQWKRDGGRYIPNPATWLNQCRWEDELPTEGKEPFGHGRTDWAALAAQMDEEEGRS